MNILGLNYNLREGLSNVLPLPESGPSTTKSVVMWRGGAVQQERCLLVTLADPTLGGWWWYTCGLVTHLKHEMYNGRL